MIKDFDADYFEARQKDSIRRHKMHELDRKLILRKLGSKGKTRLKLLDIGCANGEFSKPFLLKGWEIFGIEINQEQAEIAGKSGIRILKSIENPPNFDVVLIRGTLHHIPDATSLLESITRNFRLGDGATKHLFILAEPNSESMIYRNFQKLPAIEDSDRFSSNYQIYGAKKLKKYLNLLGYDATLSYPYFKTPYRTFVKDCCRALQMVLTNQYISTPWFRNMFNITCVYREGYDVAP
jgi:SAM-dependent methyltransferase